MFKKLSVFSFICLVSVSSSYAASLYIAPSIEYQGLSAGNIDYMGLVPKFALGYGGAVNRSGLYLAGELFGMLKSVTIHNHRAGTPGLKPNYTLGISLLPGYCLDETILLYARLGMVNTSFENLDSSQTGAQVGIGASTSLTPSWDVRAEYVYTSYRTINGIGGPISDEYVLGLLYRFG